MTAPRYQTVLLDLDHTLLDSDTSQDLAFDRAMGAIGVPDPAEILPAFVAINGSMWAAVERGEMNPEEVRLARFERLVAECGLDADPAALTEAYVAGLKEFGELYPGAIEVLAALADLVTLGLVTNGISDIQRARIDRLGLEPYFDAVVISSEVGVVKPGSEIFDLAFASLGDPPRSTALMVGDSLASDMRGGIGYGIATCWINRNGSEPDPEMAVTHEITRIDELPAVIMGG